MNTKRLLDKILDKWPAKVICFIIAIFLAIFAPKDKLDNSSLLLDYALYQVKYYTSIQL